MGIYFAFFHYEKVGNGNIDVGDQTTLKSPTSPLETFILESRKLKKEFGMKV